MTFEYQFVFQLDSISAEYKEVYQADTHSPGVPQGQLPYDAFPPKARQSCATLLVRHFALFEGGAYRGVEVIVKPIVHRQ